MAAQRAIDHLSQMSVNTASVQSIREGGEYPLPARTREELLATQAIAASAREIPREAKKKDLEDPAQEVAPGVEPIRNNRVNGQLIITPSHMPQSSPPETIPDKWLM